MKLRVALDADNFTLELARNLETDTRTFTLTGARSASGTASIAEVQPGVYSVLAGTRSFTVHIAANGDALECWLDGRRRSISVSDTRESPDLHAQSATAGPTELRTQMPGKIIKILVETGASVRAGQSVIVVEAMKMQNELKAPRNGVISKINVAEGNTVGAHQSLIVLD